MRTAYIICRKRRSIYIRPTGFRRRLQSVFCRRSARACEYRTRTFLTKLVRKHKLLLRYIFLNLQLSVSKFYSLFIFYYSALFGMHMHDTFNQGIHEPMTLVLLAPFSTVCTAGMFWINNCEFHIVHTFNMPTMHYFLLCTTNVYLSLLL